MSQEIVTAQRICDSVKALGYTCGISDTGVVEGMWDGVAIALTNTRDWLQVGTVWDCIVRRHSEPHLRVQNSVGDANGR